MKNAKSLIVILFLTCSSFSTTVTAQSKTDTAAVRKVVILDSVQGKGAIADIVAGDYCKKELAATKFVLKATEFKSKLQEDLIRNREDKISAGQQIEQKKDEQLAASRDIIKKTQKQLQHQEVRGWIYKVAVLVSVGFNIYLLTK